MGFSRRREKADLETARIAVERELREKKYDAMIAQMTEDLEVSGDLEAVDRFTLDHLNDNSQGRAGI